MGNSTNDIALKTAARYCARLAAADCSAEDREDCERWLRSDPAHELAFCHVSDVSLRIERAASSDRRLQELADRAFAGQVPSNEIAEELLANRVRAVRTHEQVNHSSFRVFRTPIALAAGVLLATVAVWMALTNPAMDLSGTSAHAQQFNAPEKTAQQIELNDGSSVYLDAGAAISVELTPSERRITILSGRALFEVAHDSRRPFVVSANNTRTVALGTQFEVERHEAQTTITLIEGSVAVSGRSDVPGADTAAWTEQLTPGKQLRVGDAATERVSYDVDTGSVISWSRGWLVFQGTRLDEAIAEINRYAEKKITLAEGSLGEMTIAGSFLAGESESIANAIAEMLPLRVVDAGSREIILFKRYN